MSLWDGHLRSCKRPAEDTPFVPALRQRVGMPDSWAMRLRPRVPPPAPAVVKNTLNSLRCNHRYYLYSSKKKTVDTSSPLNALKIRP